MSDYLYTHPYDTLRSGGDRRHRLSGNGGGVDGVDPSCAAIDLGDVRPLLRGDSRGETLLAVLAGLVAKLGALDGLNADNHCTASGWPSPATTPRSNATSCWSR